MPRKDILKVFPLVDTGEFCDVCGTNKVHDRIIRINCSFSNTHLCDEDSKDLINKIEDVLNNKKKEGNQEC